MIYLFTLHTSLAPRLKRKNYTQNNKQPKQRRANKQGSRRLYVCIASNQNSQNAADSVENNTDTVTCSAMGRGQDLRSIRINGAVVNVATNSTMSAFTQIILKGSVGVRRGTHDAAEMAAETPTFCASFLTCV